MEYAVISPFTGERIADAPDGQPSDVENAITRAHAAAPDWRKRPWSERADLLARVADVVLANAETVNELLARETGVTLADAAFVTNRTAEEFSYWATVAQSSLTSVYDADKAGPFTVSLQEVRRPHGVVASILPYNASIMGAASKLAPALLVGNTVVTKSPPQNPLALIRLFELIKEVGIGEDVAPLVTGRSVALGEALVADPRVRMISFTGSTQAGRAIQRATADRLARTALELGGKGALIVTEDADVDGAVAALAGVWTRQAGQICSIPSRGIIHASRYEEVRDRLLSVLSSLQFVTDIRTPAVPGVTPVITAEHAARVEDLITRSEDPDVRITRGAEAPSPFHVSPTLIETSSTTTPSFREEAFGPVLTLTSADDDDDAIRLANDSDYGLVNYVYTSSPERAAAIVSELDAGAFVVNGFLRHPLASAGGVKQSGIAREGRLASLEIFTELASITWTEV
jgi:acyl-CoA reductase-like NAD-dependent aldehyde dehydrogenase